MSAESYLRQNLDRRVSWWGEEGTIVGIWTEPTYQVKFDDGRELTVGVSTVEVLPIRENVRPKEGN